MDPRLDLINERALACARLMNGLTYGEACIVICRLAGSMLAGWTPARRRAALAEMGKLTEEIAADLAIGEPVGHA